MPVVVQTALATEWGSYFQKSWVDPRSPKHRLRPKEFLLPRELGRPVVPPTALATEGYLTSKRFGKGLNLILNSTVRKGQKVSIIQHFFNIS